MVTKYLEYYSILAKSRVNDKYIQEQILCTIYTVLKSSASPSYTSIMGSPEAYLGLGIVVIHCLLRHSLDNLIVR